MLGPTILLAEDDPGHQVLIRNAIHRGCADANVQVVGSGRALLRILRARRSTPLDCILLDYHLPDCDATDLLTRMRAQGIVRPTLIMSSSGEQEVAVRSLRCGCSDFIPKSEALDTDRLWQRINHALGDWSEQEDKRRRSERRLRKLAHVAEHDPLTGLHNRRYLGRMLLNRRRVFDRRGKTSLVMVDIDHFKRINDRFGHENGDRVLVAITKSLRERLGNDDVAVRYGGEEFLVVLRGSAHADAFLWAEALRVETQSLGVEGVSALRPVTISLGMVTEESARLGQETVNRADRALYLAKQRGRNRIATWRTVDVLSVINDVSIACRGDVEQRLQLLIARTGAGITSAQRFRIVHQGNRVADLSGRLADRFGLGQGQRERIRLAGVLHELGMVLLPPEILDTKRQLTLAEQLLVTRSAAAGAELAAALGADTDITRCVWRCHWTAVEADDPSDQTDSIPLDESILTVAGAFCTLTSEFPGRPAYSESAAVNELRRRWGGSHRSVLGVLASVLHEGLRVSAPANRR